MGLSFTKLLGRLFCKQEIRVVMMGLDMAGKTTILYKLKLGQVISTVATVERSPSISGELYVIVNGEELLAAGFNVETVEYKNISFSVMDVGGQGRVRTRPLWRLYFHRAQCLIFVIDSNDRDRVDDARNELLLMLQEDELRDAVLLVFANKQDLPNAMNTTQITDKLGLHPLGQRRWHIQSTSAISGEGLHEGLDWLCTTLLGDR